jgi:signal transduction histidine kinase
MPAEVRAGLRPFLTTKPGGLGLGLAIAIKIVRLHGGSLELADNRPRGVVATVSLPSPGLAPDRDVTQGSADGRRAILEHEAGVKLSD